MNSQCFKGRWNVAKGKLKQSYAALTGNRRARLSGKKDEHVGRFQNHLGKTKAEVKRVIDDVYREEHTHTSHARRN